MKRFLRSPFLWATVSLLLASGALAAWLWLDPPPVVHHAASITDEEKTLDRATAAYAKYLETKSLILQEGGNGADRINDVATHSLSAQIFSDADELREGDYRYTGAWTLTQPELVNRMVDEYGRAHVVLRGCLDGSTVSLISDADGSDITNRDWDGWRHVIEITLVTMEEGSDDLTPYSSDSLPSQECAPLE
jgi:hypothetical protein